MTTTMPIKPGDLWLARIPFTSARVIKVRPVLIMWLEADDCVVCSVTSADPRGERDVALRDWIREGLFRPSTCRVGHVSTLEQRLLLRRIGRLSEADAHQIAQVWYTENRPGWDIIPW